MQTIQKIDSTIINFINQPNSKNYIDFYTTLITANDSLLINLGKNLSSINIIEFIKQYKNHKVKGFETIPGELINEIDELKKLAMYTVLTVSFFRHDTPTAGVQHTIDSICLNKTPAGKYSDIRWFLLGEILKSKVNFTHLQMPLHWMTNLTIIPSPSYCYSQAILRNPYLIPAWQRLHDIFSFPFNTALHYFPDFSISGLVDKTDSQAIQRFCSMNIKKIEPKASNSHYQFNANPLPHRQFTAIVNSNAKPLATFDAQPVGLPKAISDFISKITTMDQNQKTKGFVDQLKGDFPNLKLAIRNTNDLHHILKHITKPCILLSFLNHFITLPSYVNDKRQFEKPCDRFFLRKILGNNTEDIKNNINIIVTLLPEGKTTLKPQQVIRKRLEKEVSQWKINQAKNPINNTVPTLNVPVRNQPVAAIIIEETQPMIMEIEGGEYEDDPVVQTAPVNIETHPDKAPEVDASPLILTHSFSTSEDSVDDERWEQSNAFRFFATVKMKAGNKEEIRPSLSGSPENEAPFNQEIAMDMESIINKRNRDNSNDDSESPNKRPKI